MTEQKIKQVGIDIGRNIRRIRLEKGYGQTDFVRMLQLKKRGHHQGNACQDRTRNPAYYWIPAQRNTGLS